MLFNVPGADRRSASGDPVTRPGFVGWFELAMVAFSCRKIPAISLQQIEHLGDFHSARILRESIPVKQPWRSGKSSPYETAPGSLPPDTARSRRRANTFISFAAWRSPLASATAMPSR